MAVIERLSQNSIKFFPDRFLKPVRFEKYQIFATKKPDRSSDLPGK